jgi:hypothetical protein
MSLSTVALPVSVEQIAVAIKQMSREDQRRLLQLVPDLSKVANEQPTRTIEQAQENIENLRVQVLAALGNQPLSPDEPFLGGLTIAQYDALTEQAKDALWDQLAGVDLMEMEEVEVNADALPA